MNGPIRWLDQPTRDEYGVTTIGYYGGWSLQIVVMIFNDRLALAEPWELGGYWYSWCFPKGGAAFLAALAWDPEVDGEPAGYIKAAALGLDGKARAAGQRAPWWLPVMA